MAEKEYEIEAITKRTTIGPAGRLERIYEVAFITRGGVRDTIEIPEKDYVPERVQKLVAELAQVHEQIMKG